MPEKEGKTTRFVGLDVHKHYLVAVAVDPDKVLFWYGNWR
jgi:hypothetical protein